MMHKTNICVLSVFFMTVLSIFSYGGNFGISGFLGLYSVNDSIYKDTYGNGNLMCGGSFSLRIVKKLEVRAGAYYFRDLGEMTITEEEIKFVLIPIELSLRYIIIGTNRIIPYIGAGVDLCFYKESLPERFQEVSEATVGFHAEIGTYVSLFRGFQLDINARYLKADVEPFEEKIGLGGPRVGIGFEYRF